MDFVVQMMVKYPEYAVLALIGPYYVAAIVSIVGLLILVIHDA